MDVLRAPIGTEHRAKHAEAADEVTLARFAMEWQTNAADGNQAKGEAEANQHPRHDSKGKACAERAPLNGKRGGGPDGNHGEVGKRYRHAWLSSVDGRRSGRLFGSKRCACVEFGIDEGVNHGVPDRSGPRRGCTLSGN